MSRAISLLRKALGDLRGQHQHIETVPRAGYRLIAAVQPGIISAHTPAEPPGQTGYLARAMAACLFLAMTGLAFWSMTSADPAANQQINAPASSEAVSLVQENSIAVLPFADLSPTGNQQYFSDGLAEEILDAITSIKGLSVAGRTSSFAYRDSGEGIRGIGKALRVNFLLEGSVRKQDDRARVTAQLIRVADGYDVWSKTFDGDLNDIFEFQESVARSIAAELSPSAADATPGRLARLLTDDREAYELYLQGRAVSRRFGRQEQLMAIEPLSKAVERDPAFADAWGPGWHDHIFSYRLQTPRETRASISAQLELL